MGQTLSEPVTSKETSVCEGGGLKVAVSSMQGWRVSMEDAHTALPSLPDDPHTAFFAVFDGHGGSAIAQHCAKQLHKRIMARPEYSRGNFHDAIQLGYLDMDHSMTQDPITKDEVSGSTAISCLLTRNSIYCGNIGDSRAVASVYGKAVELSTDHKPSLPAEKERIEAAGGWVEVNRVNGNLALSRAFGDFVFKRNISLNAKEQAVTAYPDVSVHDLTPDWEFIILACDGIWDVMTSQEVVDFVRCRLAQQESPEDVCESLLNRCLAPDCQMGGLGCDNMTVIIVCCISGSTDVQYKEKCARRCPSLSDEASEESEEGEVDGKKPDEDGEVEAPLPESEEKTET